MRQGVQGLRPHIKNTGLFFSLAMEPSFWLPGFYLSLSPTPVPICGRWRAPDGRRGGGAGESG